VNNKHLYKWASASLVLLAMGTIGLTVNGKSANAAASGFNTNGPTYQTSTVGSPTYSDPAAPNQDFPDWIIFKPNLPSSSPYALDSQYYSSATVRSEFPASDFYSYSGGPPELKLWMNSVNSPSTDGLNAIYYSPAIPKNQNYSSSNAGGQMIFENTSNGSSQVQQKNGWIGTLFSGLYTLNQKYSNLPTTYGEGLAEGGQNPYTFQYLGNHPNGYPLSLGEGDPNATTTYNINGNQLAGNYYPWRYLGYASDGSLIDNPWFPLDADPYGLLSAGSKTNADAILSNNNTMKWKTYWWKSNSPNYHYDIFGISYWENSQQANNLNTIFTDYLFAQHPAFAAQGLAYWEARLMPIGDPSQSVTDWTGWDGNNQYISLVTFPPVQPNMTMQQLHIYSLNANGTKGTDLFEAYRYPNVSGSSNEYGVATVNPATGTTTPPALQKGQTYLLEAIVTNTTKGNYTVAIDADTNAGTAEFGQLYDTNVNKTSIMYNNMTEMPTVNWQALQTANNSPVPLLAPFASTGQEAVIDYKFTVPATGSPFNQIQFISRIPPGYGASGLGYNIDPNDDTLSMKMPVSAANLDLQQLSIYNYDASTSTVGTLVQSATRSTTDPTVVTTSPTLANVVKGNSYEIKANVVNNGSVTIPITSVSSALIDASSLYDGQVGTTPTSPTGVNSPVSSLAPGASTTVTWTVTIPASSSAAPYSEDEIWAQIPSAFHAANYDGLLTDDNLTLTLNVQSYELDLQQLKVYTMNGYNLGPMMEEVYRDPNTETLTHTTVSPIPGLVKGQTYTVQAIVANNGTAPIPESGIGQGLAGYSSLFDGNVGNPTMMYNNEFYQSPNPAGQLQPGTTATVSWTFTVPTSSVPANQMELITRVNPTYHTQNMDTDVNNNQLTVTMPIVKPDLNVQQLDLYNMNGATLGTKIAELYRDPNSETIVHDLPSTLPTLIKGSSYELQVVVVNNTSEAIPTSGIGNGLIDLLQGYDGGALSVKQYLTPGTPAVLNLGQTATVTYVFSIPTSTPPSNSITLKAMLDNAYTTQNLDTDSLNNTLSATFNVTYPDLNLQNFSIYTDVNGAPGTKLYQAMRDPTTETQTDYTPSTAPGISQGTTYFLKANVYNNSSVSIPETGVASGLLGFTSLYDGNAFNTGLYYTNQTSENVSNPSYLAPYATATMTWSFTVPTGASPQSYVRFVASIPTQYHTANWDYDVNNDALNMLLPIVQDNLAITFTGWYNQWKQPITSVKPYEQVYAEYTVTQTQGGRPVGSPGVDPNITSIIGTDSTSGNIATTYPFVSDYHTASGNDQLSQVGDYVNYWVPFILTTTPEVCSSANIPSNYHNVGLDSSLADDYATAPCLATPNNISVSDATVNPTSDVTNWPYNYVYRALTVSFKLTDNDTGGGSPPILVYFYQNGNYVGQQTYYNVAENSSTNETYTLPGQYYYGNSSGLNNYNIQVVANPPTNISAYSDYWYATDNYSWLTRQINEWVPNGANPFIDNVASATYSVDEVTQPWGFCTTNYTGGPNNTWQTTYTTYVSESVNTYPSYPGTPGYEDYGYWYQRYVCTAHGHDQVCNAHGVCHNHNYCEAGYYTPVPPQWRTNSPWQINGTTASFKNTVNFSDTFYIQNVTLTDPKQSYTLVSNNNVYASPVIKAGWPFSLSITTQYTLNGYTQAMQIFNYANSLYLSQYGPRATPSNNPAYGGRWRNAWVSPSMPYMPYPPTTLFLTITNMSTGVKQTFYLYGYSYTGGGTVTQVYQLPYNQNATSIGSTIGSNILVTSPNTPAGTQYSIQMQTMPFYGTTSNPYYWDNQFCADVTAYFTVGDSYSSSVQTSIID
jgi:hypothetical protein